MEDFDIYADLPSFHAGNEDKTDNENNFINILDQNADITFNELKTAVDELKIENSKLKHDHQVALTNYSSLLLTAKAEVSRKDRTIADLRSKLDNYAFRRNNRGSNINHQNAEYYCPPKSMDQPHGSKIEQSVFQFSYPPPLINAIYVPDQNQQMVLDNSMFANPPPPISASLTYIENNYESVTNYDHPDDFANQTDIPVKKVDLKKYINNDDDSEDEFTKKTHYRATVYGERLRKKLIEEKKNEKLKKIDEAESEETKENQIEAGKKLQNEKDSVSDEMLKEEKEILHILGNVETTANNQEQTETASTAISKESQASFSKEIKHRAGDENYKIIKETKREFKKKEEILKLPKIPKIYNIEKKKREDLKKEKRNKGAEMLMVKKEQEVELEKKQKQEELDKETEGQRIEKLKLLREKELAKRIEESKIQKVREKEKKKIDESKYRREQDRQERWREESRIKQEKDLEWKKADDLRIRKEREREDRRREDVRFKRDKDLERKKSEDLRTRREKDRDERRREEESRIKHDQEIQRRKAVELMRIEREKDIEKKKRDEELRAKREKELEKRRRENMRKEKERGESRPHEGDMIILLECQNELKRKIKCQDKVNNKENLTLSNKSIQFVENNLNSSRYCNLDIVRNSAGANEKISDNNKYPDGYDQSDFRSIELNIRHSRCDRYKNSQTYNRHRSLRRNKSRHRERSKSSHALEEEKQCKYFKIHHSPDREDKMRRHKSHDRHGKCKDKVKTPKRKKRSRSEETSPRRSKRCKKNIGESSGTCKLVVSKLSEKETITPENVEGIIKLDKAKDIEETIKSNIQATEKSTELKQFFRPNLEDGEIYDSDEFMEFENPPVALSRKCFDDREKDSGISVTDEDHLSRKEDISPEIHQNNLVQEEMEHYDLVNSETKKLTSNDLNDLQVETVESLKTKVEHEEPMEIIAQILDDIELKMQENKNRNVEVETRVEHKDIKETVIIYSGIVDKYYKEPVTNVSMEEKIVDNYKSIVVAAEASPTSISVEQKQEVFERVSSTISPIEEKSIYNRNSDENCNLSENISTEQDQETSEKMKSSRIIQLKDKRKSIESFSVKIDESTNTKTESSVSDLSKKIPKNNVGSQKKSKLKNKRKSMENINLLENSQIEKKKETSEVRDTIESSIITKVNSRRKTSENMGAKNNESGDEKMGILEAGSSPVHIVSENTNTVKSTEIEKLKDKRKSVEKEESFWENSSVKTPNVIRIKGRRKLTQSVSANTDIDTLKSPRLEKLINEKKSIEIISPLKNLPTKQKQEHFEEISTVKTPKIIIVKNRRKQRESISAKKREIPSVLVSSEQEISENINYNTSPKLEKLNDQRKSVENFNEKFNKINEVPSVNISTELERSTKLNEDISFTTEKTQENRKSFENIQMKITYCTNEEKKSSSVAIPTEEKKEILEIKDVIESPIKKVDNKQDIVECISIKANENKQILPANSLTGQKQEISENINVNKLFNSIKLNETSDDEKHSKQHPLNKLQKQQQIETLFGSETPPRNKTGLMKSVNKEPDYRPRPKATNVIIVRRRRKPVQLSDSPPVVVINQMDLNKSK